MAHWNMSFQKPRAASGELVVGLLIMFLGACQSRSLTPGAWTKGDTPGMDIFRTGQVLPPIRRKGWLFPCSGYGLLWPGITGNTSGHVLSSEQGADHGQNKDFGSNNGILAFSTSGSCISSLFGPSMFSSSAASLVSCPCHISSS